MEDKTKLELKKTATKVRMGIITAVSSAGSGHPGGSLSLADILTFLYFKEMNIDPKNPKNPDRDRFVLSKGHCTPALYSTLANRGFFPVEDLADFRQVSSYLEGHPNMDKVPGVDMSTGSLGQGISAAVGMAMAGKLDNKNYRVYAALGDGELEEGQVWEAAMCASHYKLDNLTAFIDYNGLQIDGNITEVMNPEPIADKFAAFGWNVISINAHNFDEIEQAVNKAKAFKGKPTAIVAHSIKGKGVSYMENQAGWHGSAPKKEQAEQAQAELESYLKSL
ncbi:MAG: transketolase [Acetivibrionales bacterium]|jgi:transketolase|nr:transketolase [Clostridiaceae bacterium]